MRKVLSFVLVLALVLSSFSMAFADDAATTTDAAVTAPATETAAPAATETEATTSIASALTDIAGLDCEQAVKVLVDLGVIKGYTDNTYKPTNTVTRAEAAVIVIKALGLEKSVGSQKSSYTDMAGYGWAEPYIAFASNLGILQGYGDGTYKPGAVVSYNEFCAILVRSLGYTTDSLTGTWPGNYVNKAAGLGIMDNVVSGGNNGANRGDVAIMTSNNLTNYIGTIDKDGNFQATIISGTVAAGNAVYDNYAYRLDCDEETAVIVDNDGAVINTMPYLGKYCTYYTNDDGDIVAVKEVKSVTLTGDIDSKVATELEGDDDVNYNLPDNYEFENAKGKTVDAYAVNNGASVGSTSAAAVVGTKNLTFEVKLSGKTVKEVYSVATWTENGFEKVTAADLEDLKDAELLGFDFDTNKDGSINTNSFELVGVNSLNDIKADNVVYVYTEKGLKDKVIKKVAVGTKIVEGTITKENESDSEWTVNKEVYGMAGDDVVKTAFKAGNLDNDIKAWLDAYGDIYDYDITSGSADDYAVVKDTTGSYGGAKLFLADGTSKAFDVDDVDFSGLDFGLVGYGLNKSGEVDTLKADFGTVSAAAMSNSVLKVTTGEAAKVTAGSYTIDSNVVLFTVNGTPGTTTKDVDVAKIAELTKFDPKANTGVYDMLVLLNDDGDVAAIVVDEDAVDGTDEDSYAVISDFTAATNPAGYKAQELTGFIDGKKMNDVYTDDEGVVVRNDVKTPNLYKLSIDSDGYITEIEAVGNTPEFGYATSGSGTQYASDGIVKVSSTTNTAVVTSSVAVASNAVVYSVEFKDNGNVDEYAKYSGTIKADKRVWMYNFDDDDSEYDVVIVEK